MGGAATQSTLSEQLVDVDVLARQAGPQHVVRVRHDLDADALQVGVHGPGGDEQRLPRLQRHRVEQDGRDRARVARVRGREPHDRAVGARRRRPVGEPARAGLGELGDVRGARPGLGLQEPLERGAHARRRRVRGEQGVQVRGERGVEVREQLRGPARGTEPDHGVEPGQRVHQLRLVVVVPVAALGCGHGDPRGVLGREAGPRALERRVHLQGQRGVRRDDLEQVGQAGAEPRRDVRAEVDGRGRPR